jgi:hypothetical protein
MVLFGIGILLSVVWLWAGWYYVSVYVGQGNIFQFLPAELGQFLIGFLTPLGVLWLLISQSATRRRMARLERQVGELASRLPDEPAAAHREPHFGRADAPAGEPEDAPEDAEEMAARANAPQVTPADRAERDWESQETAAAPKPAPRPPAASAGPKGGGSGSAKR